MIDADRALARREIAARGLTPVAVSHLTRDALGTIAFDVLAPVKKLLKQFFSGAAWTDADDHALAQLVGSGSGWWRYELDDDFELEFGWREDAFRIDVVPRRERSETFASPVVPEATPNPRTIRFVTPAIHEGPSRWYESATAVDDPRVARLFAEFDEVANVLVGPDFVAVGLRHPDRWEQLLDSILRAITNDFTSNAGGGEPRDDHDADDTATQPRDEAAKRGSSALERAWKALGTLRPDVPDELERIITSTSSTNGADRQVAARMLIGADPLRAEQAWGRLLADPSRSVRRATVDAMVDAQRPTLRSLLERALRDEDAWTRWKALRGLVDVDAAPSRAAIAPLADDHDFRVRLEVHRALNDGE